jgi:F-type H+-transporting ATPase subunit b
VFDFSQWTFAFVFANLVILYFALKHFLFKPVTAMLEKRKKSIEDSINDSEEKQRAAAALKTEYEEKLKGAHAESQRLVSEARDRANREAEGIVSDARQEAERLTARAREEIDRERERMMKELQGEVAGLALAAASKLLEENMDTEKNRAFVDRFIKSEGVA